MNKQKLESIGEYLNIFSKHEVDRELIKSLSFIRKQYSIIFPKISHLHVSQSNNGMSNKDEL